MTELWDRRIPAAEDCVLAALLERRARETPDKVFVVFEDDETWTYAQTLRHVRQAALGLQQLGVRQGDIVLSWLPTGRECLKASAELFIGEHHDALGGSPQTVRIT